MRPARLLFVLVTAACTSGDDGFGPNDPPAEWSLPAPVAGTGARIAAGDRLHLIAMVGGGLEHRSSADEGATWSGPTPIAAPGAVLPLYGPVAVAGAVVHVLTREGGVLRMRRSLDGGATWSPPTTLTGYNSDESDRVQVDTDGDFVHVFAGRAGAVPDSSFKNYHWRSPDRGATWSGATVLGDPAGPPSPGGIAADGGVVHIAYAAIVPGVGTLGHRSRYIRSLDNGATWSAPVDISGGSTNPQIRTRPRVQNGRVIAMWEEPLDHIPTGPYPNATRAQIRANRSPDNGATWTGTFDITAVSGLYPNHPEIAVGPGALLHVAYRLSQDQSTLTNADRIGYRLSTDFGATWGEHETAIDMPAVETHPYNAVATRNFVHLLVGGGPFYHARRSLPEAP